MNVVSFYRFSNVGEPKRLCSDLLGFCRERGVLGTILVAEEGVNGTLCGDRRSLQSVLQWLEDRLSLADSLDGRWTEADEAPFQRMRVKLKEEIVALGRPDIRPEHRAGAHVGPRTWNSLLDNPETLIIDTRNHYEIEVGTFPNAIDPQTDSFRQFPDFAEKLEAERGRPIAMFCTGGIRCEKAAALLKELGFDNVYQLEGGVLNYLETVPDGENRWQGECFVFDKRVAVDRDLAEGGYVQCHACRRPLSSEDLQSPDYREGVSCSRCAGTLDERRVKRLEERRKQVGLARKRGIDHIGAELD